MLNDPNRPYKLPQDNNPENRRRAFYLVIALAVVLTTIPLVFLVFRGWLSAEPSAAEPVAQSQPLPVSAPVTTEQPPPMVAETPVATAAPAIPTAGTEPAVPDSGAIAVDPGLPTSLPAPTPADTGMTAVTGSVPAVEPATAVAAPAAAEPAVAPPPPVAAVTAVTAAPSKPAAPAKKPTFTPLTAEERAKLSAANDRAKQSSAASAKIVQPSADYKKKLTGFVRSQWLPPSASEIGNAKLKAAITVEVAANGAVKSAKLSRTSGNRKMDATVTSLATRLRSRKAPAPGNGTVRVEIELRCE